MEIKMSINYHVIDLETSGEHSFGRFCNPLDARNAITSIAIFDSQTQDIKTAYNKDSIPRTAKLPLLHKLLVGQNIKFDLLYLWTNPSLIDWLHSGGIIWDTMLAEYLLTAQQTGENDLDSLALKYGGTLKDSYISDCFKAGLKSNEIDKDRLLEYNLQDVKNTDLIFKAQYREAKRRGILPLMRTYMDHLLAITEMEFNGMYVNREIADVKQLELEDHRAAVELKMLGYFNSIYQHNNFWPAAHLFDYNSAQQVSLLLFGGDYYNVEDVPTGAIYKTGAHKGEVKTKKEKIKYRIPGLYNPQKLWETKKAGVFSVKDDVLQTLAREKANDDSLTGQNDFLQLLREYRSLNKLLTTYYYQEILDKDGAVKKVSGILSKIHPSTGTLHSSFNCAVTETGRLSSSAPNGQNLPAEILDMFTSRWGEEGEIVEIDMSQLEIVVQAYLTQSDPMIEAIKAGVDFHRMRLGYALNKSYEDVINVPGYEKKRKEIAKPISFQKAYGAMPETVHIRTGIPLETVKRVFEAEDRAYPEIPAFYKQIVEEVKYTRTMADELADIRVKNGENFTIETERAASGYYQTFTGKRYQFQEKVMQTQRGLFRYFHMPDIQNYPVQGTAADIVSLLVGTVFKDCVLRHRDDCKMIQEVHDSLILDVKKEKKELIINEVYSIMNSGAELLKKRFGVVWNVPLKADIKSGSSWAKCKE